MSGPIWVKLSGIVKRGCENDIAKHFSPRDRGYGEEDPEEEVVGLLRQQLPVPEHLVDVLVLLLLVPHHLKHESVTGKKDIELPELHSPARSCPSR